ncbi:MAP kinase kinase [Tieghemostelium lacteum]|uniref:mitogen-activated protein kinase kinase n=1 Tax=Tieghemostelium lacteum TaxID=361077 RepID=A0A152A174_TIELA|nr:MAP kinase kinase [Tieghemostelium lacteum]|eukprot:KYQ99948.1 MAP kinase kinase [Tieghemostelium lacteum]
MYQNKKVNLQIKIENQPDIKDQNKSFSFTDSGTWKEGDLLINKKGLLVKGESPKNSPVNKTKPISTNSNFYQPNNKATTLQQPQQQQLQQNESQPNYDGLISLDLKDLKIIKILGRGAGGIVKLAYHQNSGTYFALKVITLDIQENARKQILLELKTLYKTHCKWVVSFYDAFYTDGSIHIALEYMQRGSLADIIKRTQTLPEPILSRITYQVLEGLVYLHRQLHTIHRDIKPSNILLNQSGEAKIADFGTSGELQHTLSKAVTWVGTVTYMSPERISGRSYAFDSDIWSLGLTILECALGRFPYGNPLIENNSYNSSSNIDKSNSNSNNNSLPIDQNNNNNNNNQEGIGFWVLLDCIVKEPVPFPPSDKFSPEFCSFISECLVKEPEDRPSAHSLLCHPFIQKYQATVDNMAVEEYLSNIMDKKNKE